MKLWGLGAAMTLVVTGVLWLIWRQAAIMPGLVFGTLATAIHVAAVTLARWGKARPIKQFLFLWCIGIGLRLVGIVIFVLAVVTNPELFPPLPTAFALLGVLVPLLFTEPKFLT